MPSRHWVGFVIVSFCAVPLWAARAQAADGGDARGYVDKATAAYALNRYAVAAENFEKAFELKPDPALLYNAAQAYRLAGNKERALELYESYLRVYGKKEKRDQIEGRIKELKEAIAHDKALTTSPPVTTEPAAGVLGSGPAAPGAAPSVVPISAPRAQTPTDDQSTPGLLTQTTGAPAKDDSIAKKPWFWGAAGVGVVAAVVVVLLLTTGGSSAAMPSLGKAAGN